MSNCTKPTQTFCTNYSQVYINIKHVCYLCLQENSQLVKNGFLCCKKLTQTRSFAYADNTLGTNIFLAHIQNPTQNNRSTQRDRQHPGWSRLFLMTYEFSKVDNPTTRNHGSATDNTQTYVAYIHKHMWTLHLYIL